ncbi:MAG: hypothetical protein GXO78_05660 [Calditrichaeota bacterium]|nr:hypothetical protein [Calditrichota bacterium]
MVLYRFTPVVDTALMRVLNAATGPEIQIRYANISGNLIGEVRLDGLEIEAPQGRLVAEKTILKYRLLDLVNQRYVFDRIVLFRPVATIRVATDTSRGAPSEEETNALPVPRPLDLSGVPVIQVRQLVVTDGRVFVLKGQDTVQVITDIQIELKGELNEERVELRPRYIRGFWKNHNLRLQQLKFQLIGNRKRITVNQLEASLGDSRLIGHGEVEFVPELKFYLFTDTSTINLTTLHAIFPSLPYKTGYIRLYGSFIGNFQEYSGEVFLESLLDSLRIDRLSLRYKKKARRYEIEEILFRSNFGNAKGRGSLSPADWNQFNLAFSNWNLQRLALADIETHLSGHLQVRFKDWDLNRMEGRAHLHLFPARLDAARLDSVYLDVSWKRGRFFLREGSRIVVGPSSRFDISGRISPQRDLDIRVKSLRNQLDTLATHLPLPPVRGQGQLEFHITGKLDNPNIDGRIFLDSVQYQNIRLKGVQANIQVLNVATQRLGIFSLDIASGELGTVPVTDGRLRFRIQRNVVFLDSIQFVSRQNRVFTQGRLAYARQRWWLTLFQFQFRYQDYRLRNRQPLRLIWGEDSLKIAHLALFTRDGGQLQARGVITGNGASNVELEIHKIRLAALHPFLKTDYALDGQLQGKARLRGTIDHPEIALEVDVNDFSVDGRILGNLLARAVLQQNRLEMKRLDFRQREGGQVTFHGMVQLPSEKLSLASLLNPRNTFESRLQFENFQLKDAAFFLKTNVPVQGQINGQLELTHTIGAPRGNYNFQLQRLQYGEYQFPYVELDGRIQPHRILLDFARVNFLNTELRLNGWKAIQWNPEHPEQIFANRAFGLLCRIQEDSLNFLGVVEPEVDRIVGDINIFLKLGGLIDRPRLLEAEASIKDGQIYLNKVANPITDVQFQAHLEDQFLIIDQFEGAASRTAYERGFWDRVWRFVTRPLQFLGLVEEETGRIEGKGQIDLSDIFRPGYDLRLKAHQAYVNYFIENVHLVFSTDNLRITGRDTIWVRGDIFIDEGDVELDIAETEKNLLLSPTVREIPPFVAYDLDVSIPGNFFIISNAPFNTFNLEISGDLRVIQEPRAPLEMNGYLEILKGKYFVQIEEFKIQEGRINFVNPKELPELHIVAQKRKYDLIFVLTVRGRLNNPVKEITIYDARDPSQPLPYPDVKDQMALLMFGVPFSELQSQIGTKLLEKGEEIITQTLISQIEKEARHFIGLDQIRIETAPSRTLLEDARLNPEPATLALGKYLTPKLYFEYKSRLASTRIPGLMNIPTPQLRWEAGNQIYLEYRIGRNWSISSFYEKTIEGNARIKFDISWQINF